VGQDKKRDKEHSKNPFKSYRRYITHAEKCTLEMRELPDLDLSSVEHLLYQRPKEAEIKAEHLVTLGILKHGRRTGTLRKVLHVPSFSVHVSREQPVENKAMLSEIKQWICTAWRGLEAYDCFLKVSQSPFWNLPEGCITILSEFAEGGSLQDLLRTAITLPEKALRQLLCQLLEAFLIADQEGLAYSGLSPTQLLFTADGQLRLSLGLSRLVSEQLDGGLYDANYGEVGTEVFKIGLLALQCAIGNF
jgi:hypothetical protein